SRRSSASARSSPPPSSARSAIRAGSITGTASPPTTAPPPLRCPPAGGRSTGYRCAATAASTTPSTWPQSPRSGMPTAPAAPTSTARSQKARPARKPSARSSASSVTPSTPGSRPAPPAPGPPKLTVREGNRGTALSPARPAHTPGTGSSDKPLPDQHPAYDQPPWPGEQYQPRRSTPRAERLDNKEVFNLGVERRLMVRRMVTTEQDDLRAGRRRVEVSALYLLARLRPVHQVRVGRSAAVLSRETAYAAGAARGAGRAGRSGAGVSGRARRGRP